MQVVQTIWRYATGGEIWENLTCPQTNETKIPAGTTNRYLPNTDYYDRYTFTSAKGKEDWFRLGTDTYQKAKQGLMTSGGLNRPRTYSSIPFNVSIS